MKMRSCLIALTSLISVGAYAQTETPPPTQPPAQAAPQEVVVPKTKRVMVVTFQQTDRKVKDSIPLGQEIADMMTIALVEKGGRVVERTEMAALEKERGFQNGVSDKGILVELGKLKGAAVAVMGKITEFDVVEKKSEGVEKQLSKGIGGLLKKRTGANTDNKQYEIHVAMDIRLVNVETGDILAATNAAMVEPTDQSDVNSLFMRGGGQAAFALGLKSLTKDTSSDTPKDKNTEWNETKAGQFARRVVNTLVNRVFDKIPLAAEGEVDDQVGQVLQFLNLGEYGEASKLVDSLEKIKGVIEAEIKNFTPEKTEIFVRGASKTMKNIAGALLKDETAKALGLKVISANKEGVVFGK